jgi:hypothetical protein
MKPEFNPDSLEAVLARMESRQIVNTERLEQIITRLDKHEERIHMLESFKWRLLGALTLGSAGGAAAFSKLFSN